MSQQSNEVHADNVDTLDYSAGSIIMTFSDCNPTLRADPEVASVKSSELMEL